jgi:hypothetical protein
LPNNYHDGEADEHRRRYSSVNIPVVFVGTLLVSREGGDASCVGRLDDGVKVEGWRGLIVGFFGEVGQVEGYTTIPSTGAGHKLAEFCLELYYNEGTPRLLNCYLGDRQNMKKPPADVSIA